MIEKYLNNQLNLFYFFDKYYKFFFSYVPKVLDIKI